MADKTILIHLPNWVGDALLAAPAIRALVKARPDARFILMGTRRSAPLYGRWVCDLLFPLDRPDLRNPLGLALRLKSHRIGEALILAPSFRSALPPFLAGIPRRVGYASDSRAILLTERPAIPSRSVHLTRQYMELAVRLGADPESELDPILPVGEDEIEREARRLTDLAVEGPRTIGFCPGATYGVTKRWPLDHWIRLGRFLTSGGWSVVVLGGESEKGDGETIVKDLGSTSHNLAGQLTLRESLAMFRLLRAAVSNDSGAMHLAAAAGCPVLGLFGSTNPAWTGPLGVRSRALWLGIPCSPCYARNCPTQIECLRDLAPDRVASEIEALIA